MVGAEADAARGTAGAPVRSGRRACAQTGALLWIAVRPGALQQTAQSLSAHAHVRFCATTGPANLVVAVVAADLDALCTFLADAVGPLEAVTAIDATPLLATVKRSGLIRR